MYIFLIFVFLLLYLYYIYAIKPNRYWQKKNLAYKKIWPIVGDKGMLGMTSLVDMAIEDYQQFKDEPFYGSVILARPTIVVNDPALIRDISIKDFDHFQDHPEFFVRHELDPILASSILFKQGKAWKDLRSILSPLFTGSKMRIMFNLVVDCSQHFVDVYLEKVKKEKPLIVEMKELSGRLSGDMIASCAFGIKCDSITNPKNEFYVRAKELVHFSTFRTIVTIIFTKVCLILNYGLVPKRVYNFFESFLYDNLKAREENQIYRPDMIQLMTQIRKGELQQEEEVDDDAEYSAAKDTSHYIKKVSSQCEITDHDFLAQILSFLLGGYDTTSTVLAFTLYQLAVNADVQSRLQKEIDENLESFKGEITYEGIRDMKYLDMVVSEGLRMHTPAAVTDRLCTKDYILKAKTKEILIEKGMTVTIPILPIHYDPMYHPNPMKFDPERFSKKNRGNIKDFTYFPFGFGPRNCIGSRFGLMQVKIALFSILAKLDVCVCSKTQIPIKYKKSPFLILPEKGIWVELKERNNQ